MYLRGRLQADIAQELGIGQATVSRDLKALQQEWQQSALVNIDAAKARELARVDELERTCWTEWEASKQEKHSTIREQVDGAQGTRKKAQMKQEERLGDPRYLQGVQWCIERRCKILGIDAPSRAELSGKGGKDLLDVQGLIDLLRRAEEAVGNGAG